MDTLLAAWGIGAQLLTRGRSSDMSVAAAGLPPMSAVECNSVVAFPFMLFDHVILDECSYDALLESGVHGFRLSDSSKRLLRLLREEEVLRLVDSHELLGARYEEMQGEFQQALDDPAIRESAQYSRTLWARFLTSPGGEAHPTKAHELAITAAELELLEQGISLDEARRRFAHDVADVTAMLKLAVLLDIHTVCDWQMYAPFYANRLVGAMLSGSADNLEFNRALHENLDIFVSLPNTHDPEEVLTARSRFAREAFQRYLMFLSAKTGDYSVDEFLELRRSVLSNKNKQMTHLGVFPASVGSPTVISEDYIRNVVQSEIKAELARREKDRIQLVQIFQAISEKGNAEIQLDGAGDHHELIQQLEQLSTALRSQGTDSTVAEAIDSAARSAAEGNDSGLRTNLARAGIAALRIARDIGVDLAASALRKSLGL